MRTARFLLVFVSALGLAACGRGGLELGNGSDGAGGDGAAGAGGPGSGAGAPGSGAGGPGSGAGSPGSGAGGPGSGAGGPGSGAGGPGSGGVGGTEEICMPLGDGCTGCISDNCPADWCGCVNNPDCLDLFSCFGQCNGEPNCEQTCLTVYEDGIASVLLVSGCAGTTCDPQCIWGNPEFTDCQECIYNDCAAEANACFALPSCGALWGCLTDCPQLDLSCQQGCYNSFGDGTMALETMLQCVVNQCSDPCQQ